MFLVLPILRRKYPNAPRPYRVPGGIFGCWICAILAELFVIVTGLTLLWPGLVESWFGETFNLQDYLGLTVSRTFFEVATLGTFGAMILLAIVFLREAGIELPATLPEGLVVIALGALATIFVLIRVISIPDEFFGWHSRGVGIFISLAASVLVIAAGLLRAGEEL